jgi:hypothetical protein
MFPRSPQLLQGRFFYNSAFDLMEYLCDEKGMALPPENVLWLFDDTHSPSDQLVEIAEFLDNRESYLKSTGTRPDHLLIYYVGHGLFTRGAEQAYCLAVRSTNQINEGATSMRAAELAGVIKERAAFLKRYLILDCCFAASMYKEFQSGPLTVARVQLNKEFPQRGTALMCSSNALEPARAPRGLEHTMFSSALIHGLRKGYERGGPLLSFSELGDIIRENLREAFPESWVRPEVLSPDQREGDIAHLPLFPNPAYIGSRKIRNRVNPARAEGRKSQNAAAIEAPVRRLTRAAPKAEPAQQSARNKKKQVSTADSRSASPAKSSKGKQAKSVAKSQRTASNRKLKLAAVEGERKKQLAAQKAAQKLFQEWQRSQRAKELERKRLAKQREEERLARKAAEVERLRKERLAAQEAAAERVLKRLKRERANAAGRSSSTPTPRPTTRVSTANSNRIPGKSAEARDRKKALRAAQDAAADRVLKRIRNDRKKDAERRKLARLRSEEENRKWLEADTSEDSPAEEEFATTEPSEWQDEGSIAENNAGSTNVGGWLANWLKRHE